MFAQESRAALAALSFLTRVPVAARLDADDVRRSGTYFPLVGSGIGVITGLTARRVGPVPGLVAETLLTGALHLDALADSADALGGGNRERALEIMRDSRVGSFGTAAVCLDLLLKATALEGCADPLRTLLSAGALSRTVPVLLSASLPYAREDGTGRALSSGSWARALAAVLLASGISRDRGAIVVAGLVYLACAGFWSRRLGGITGDTLGASVELTEAAILLWCARPR